MFLGLLIIAPQFIQATELETSFDFRVRYEYTNDESQSEKRRRNRVRARLSAEYFANERLRIKVRLATAEANTTGANQTLGHGFSLSDAGMDQLFIDYALTDNSSFFLGKMSNPFFKPNKSQLVFDGDYNPEGVAMSFNKDNYFGNIGLIKFDEGSSKAVNMSGFQIGKNTKISSQTSYKIALAQYNFDNIKGRPATDITWNGQIFGNPVDTNNNYLNNYNVTNLSAEIKTKLGVDSIPTIFWRVTYLYKDAEKNAVFGALVDSDFGGGGVDHKGHQLNVGYNLSKKLSIEFTWFDNKKKMDIDYRKAFVDLKYKF